MSEPSQNNRSYKFPRPSAALRGSKSQVPDINPTRSDQGYQARAAQKNIGRCIRIVNLEMDAPACRRRMEAIEAIGSGAASEYGDELNEGWASTARRQLRRQL
ncbi:hypothetical protein ONZ51_g5558 [Trametes cubensis]|uniref:Uncharacterized protein n=1 Tax=Trametes cubensis TaxID=1111947 RepID=A0AAD7XBF6_9APHY|nr:hypothetical protein ONZ51_g5558 [Trametes cubensis]